MRGNIPSPILPISPFPLSTVILVDEVLARVVRRVDVDHLHLFSVGTQQQFQRLQILPLDDHVAICLVGIHGAGLIIDEGGGGGSEGLALGGGFAISLEFVALGLVDFVRGDEAFQFVGIEAAFVGEEIGEEALEFVEAFLPEIRRGGKQVTAF